FFGDGAVNQGAFHESANLAAIWKLPVIYVCENNQYAESLPVKNAFAVDDISRRAEGYGMPGVRVNGRDVRAVYDAAGELIARARGPRPVRQRLRSRCPGMSMQATEAQPRVGQATREMFYNEALGDALRLEMERDTRVIVLGEDIAEHGGAFQVTAGLLDKFGPTRIRQTPISELGIVGAAVGAALTGLRPVVELMYVDFSGLA